MTRDQPSAGVGGQMNLVVNGPGSALRLPVRVLSDLLSFDSAPCVALRDGLAGKHSCSMAGVV
jgi:hypothetical protein